MKDTIPESVEETLHALLNSHRMYRQDVDQLNAINATLEMQAKRDAAEISCLRTKLRSLAQTTRKRKKARSK